MGTLIMIYQLPNGKVIYLSTEDYLSLTDKDIQYLMSMNAGDYPRSPWEGSAIKNPRRRQDEDDEEEEDRSIDYHPELDEPLGPDTPEPFEDEDFSELSDDIL